MIKITAKETRDKKSVHATAKAKNGNIFELTSAAMKIREIALQWPNPTRDDVLVMLADAVKNGIGETSEEE